MYGESLFSLFNIVSFRNNACTSTGSSNQAGTCLTSSECGSKGGSALGNCASGFGVCCIFTVSGSCGSTQTIAQNCSYIQNSGYPTADTTISETCTYNFNRICDSKIVISFCFVFYSMGINSAQISKFCKFQILITWLDFNSLTSLAATTGYCQLQVRESLATTPDPFLLSAPTTEALTACADLSFITLSTPNLGSFCGGILNTVNGNTIPGVVTSSPGSNFQVGVNTLAGDLSDLTGFNLNYNQVPCA
ncbi:hypothetical protein TCAL_11243 [Tigriopus californicus]|uniref:CUB domain-containing protein n=1 Tax=Tigriopus californicus TaxID=6832 RepID=A0A553N8J8_TIGCA|nr:hypothetical protein TCAL_11243 [Tigriopus californicus]